MPARSLGRVAVDSGSGVAFAYRPWLVLPRRTVPLPHVDAVGRGLLSPVLLSSAGAERVVVRLPPRFRRQATELGRLLGLPVMDVPAVRGLRAAWSWLRGEGPPPSTATFGR